MQTIVIFFITILEIYLKKARYNPTLLIVAIVIIAVPDNVIEIVLNDFAKLIWDVTASDAYKDKKINAMSAVIMLTSLNLRVNTEVK